MGTIHMITITKTNLRMAGLESSALSAQRSTFNPQVLLIDAGCNGTKILASGISSAFFPHGLGRSLGMDVHDVPSASIETAVNLTMEKNACRLDMRVTTPI
ncbi:hypothetical protein BDP27DRAFT_1343246 [Rhodocollybia butyracea]|uniref:Uncharacterized protein n=1 Tax=Rhodocollybia butyracea TaxID=206335 RepID=A0A9P5TWQ9_9AGAR|nr:hypothetical protein BDP27DRAFT_1343246 [Rhodocollybia butyracea]